MIEIYSSGLVHCSVCAPSILGKEEVEKEVNRINHPGTANGWVIEEFTDGTPNPSPCEQRAEHRHWVLTC